MDRGTAKRGMKIIGISLLVYALLVASHEGEFWPFSIYPMFSQAGNPWTRAIVLDVTDIPDEQIWSVQTLSGRTSEAVPVGQYGVDQIDFSNFVSKTRQWTETRKQALHGMFGTENIGNHRWMVSKARGELVGEDSVVVEIQPFLLLTADSVYTNPNLNESDYFAGGRR